MVTAGADVGVLLSVALLLLLWVFRLSLLGESDCLWIADALAALSLALESLKLALALGVTTVVIVTDLFSLSSLIFLQAIIFEWLFG